MATAIGIFASNAWLMPPLRTSEAKSQLLDLLPIAAYVCDRNGAIVHYNRHAGELWGQSPEYCEPQPLFCGSPRMFRLDGRALPHDECPMAEVLRTGIPVHGREVVVERPDGSRAVALVNVEPLVDDTGVLTGAINCFLDVTERKNLRKLSKTEARWRSLLESLPAAIYITDEHGRITFYNEAAVTLWGVRPEIGESEWCGSWQLRWPNGRPMRHDECPMAMALNEGVEKHGAEAIAVRPDGVEVPFLAFPTPLRDSAGTLVGAINMLVDISERKKIEHAANLLAAIVESSDDAIVSKDLCGIITSWNRGAQQLFGYSSEEVVGQPVTMLIPSDRQDEETHILERLRRGERVDHYETVRRRKNGELVDVALTISPVRDASGQIVGASKIARDITDRRRADEQRQLVLREMAHRVKNLFALASGLVGQSARWANTPEEVAIAAKERLEALAQAHELTLSGPGSGDDTVRHSTDLGTVIGRILSPYQNSGRSQRTVVAGPHVLIGGDAATGFALLLHEFATNAAKYGALSTPAGKVIVEWLVEGGQLQLTWREVGGPAVAGTPMQEGFGGVLASRTVERQFAGKLTREWLREGLVIRLTIPLGQLGG